MAILVGGGTLILAFTAWKSIRQTRDIQKNEQRVRIINEIIGWAVDVANFSTEFGSPFTTALTTSRLGIDTRIDMQNMKWQSDAESLIIRSKCIIPMTFTFGMESQRWKALTSAIDNTIHALSSYITFLEDEKIDEVKFKRDALSSAMSVLEEASKIKYMLLKS